MTLVMGCTDDFNHYSMVDRTKAIDKMKVSPAVPSAEPKGSEINGRQIFTFRAPPGQGPTSDSGLEVVARCESPRTHEGYRVRVFALVPNGPCGKATEISLGGQDIFRPLDKGEDTSIFIDAVNKKAWVKKGESFELELGLMIEPSRPSRPKPEVSLQIVNAKLEI